MQKYDFSIHSQEDEDLRCPICNYYFSNITKPYLLPCNHNLCSKCIDSIVGKKMNMCPICRNPFSESDRKIFQVNFAFLNLVVKILKTKVIFCKKCGKIFNWIDHHSVCDQIEFKETNEILDEIKKLTEDSYTILKYLDKHKNIMTRSKNSIYENAQEFLKIINLKFNDHFHNTIENFFKHVPDLNLELYIKDLLEYLKVVKPLHNYIDLIEKPDISPINKVKDVFFTTPKKYNNNFQNSSNTINSDRHKFSFQDENSQMTNTNYTPRHAKSSLSNKTIFNLQRHKTFTAQTSNNLMNKTADGIKNINSFDTGKYLMHKSQVFNEQPEDKEHNSEDLSNENFNECESAEIKERSFSNGIKINHLPHLNMRIDRNNNLFLRNSYEIQRGSIINKEESPKIINNNSSNSHNTNILNFNYNFNITELIDDKCPNKTEKEGSNQTLKNKQKIVVRNDKIEILNSNGKSKNFVSHFEKSPSVTSAQPKRENNINEMYNIKKFETNQPKSETTTDGNPHDTINEILIIYNKTKEIVERISRYTSQVEFTSESIKNQISSNYNYSSDNILRSLNSLCDNLTLEFKSQHRRSIINLIEGGKKIWIYDVKKMKCETKEFVNLNIKLSNSSSIEFDDMDLIFITGGKFSSFMFDSDSSYSNVFLILRWSNKSIELNSQMPRKRAFHSSIYLDNKLYVIGGSSSINSAIMSLKDCECYDIIDKRWELLPQMNSARCNPSLCIYNGRYLYAFRGWTCNKEETNYLDTIEYLNVKDTSTGWVSITPEDPGMCWYGAANSIASVISDRIILICGGINATNKLLNHTFVYDPLLKIVYRSKDMTKSAYFNSISTIYENNLIMIDTKNDTNKPNGLHTYDLENKRWKFNQI